MATRHRTGLSTAYTRLISALLFSLGLSIAVVATSVSSGATLATPAYWPWLLTGLQVLALWISGKGRSWGWLVGGAVQPVWIAYAVVTGQLGFLPGCLISAWVQTATFMRQTKGEEGHDHTYRANTDSRHRRWPGRAVGWISP